MQIRIDHNIRQVQRGLNDVARRQIPFATSKAINDALREIERNMIKRMRRVLDRPTRFTLRAFAIRRASKRRLTGAIFARDRQAGYLSFAESGGTRRPDGRALAVPTGRRLNRFGNVPRGGVRSDLGKDRVFSGKPKGNQGPAGVYQRMGRGGRAALRQLYIYKPFTRYLRKPLGFGKTARTTAEKRLPTLLQRALLAAIRTARR
ncbi:hypothetical protein [Roseovarius sp. MBR-154]